MNVVVDTSVAVAWYLNETFSVEARKWQERALSGRDTIIVPYLHFLEFANVLRTYVRRGEIEKELAQAIYGLHIDAPLEAVEPRHSDVLDTALEYEATAYDAAYIMLAVMLDAPLITAERSTTPWLVKLGKRVISIAS